VVLVGRDANNTLDFANVDHWEDNKLDRTQSSRMGWSDVALSLAGPVVQDLRTHFAQRWNFIYDAKYSKKATRYARIPDTSSGAQVGGTYPPPPEQQRGFEGEGDGQRGFGGDGEGERGLFGHSGGLRQKIASRVNEGYHQMESQYGHGHDDFQQSHAEHGAQRGGSDCQITRSSAKWSHNITTEVSTSENWTAGETLLTALALDPKRILRDYQKQPALRLHRKPVLHHSYWRYAEASEESDWCSYGRAYCSCCS
jgi:phospholipase D1/2